MKTKKSLSEIYSFPGFRARVKFKKGILGDQKARVLDLIRRQKKTICSSCGKASKSYYDQRIHRVRDLNCGDMRIFLEFEYRRVECKHCQAVRQEFIPWLSNNKRVTQRFAREIGRMCREVSVIRVAAMHNLSWGQVRRLEMIYMKELVDKYPTSKRLRAIGVDEVSIKKGHRYAIVVADMDQQRPIWMSTTLGRDKGHMDAFYKELGDKQCKEIEIAVMDMWKPFRNSLNDNAPQAQIIYDKFHVLGHLNDAIDKVRRQEYKRASEKDRKFIKGQRYTLLSKEANLNLKGQESLKLLLKVNKRLNKAYVMKESFAQLWDYDDPAKARQFFDNWKSQLRWSRLKPYQNFVNLIERHWNGIVSYCDPNHKVSLGFMEGLINKIRVIQRRSYGIQNLEYLKLKIITSFIKDQPL